MTKQGNPTHRTPQAKKQSDHASRQISKQASGSANAPHDIVFTAMGPILGTTQTTATTASTEGLQRATFTTPPQTVPGTNTTEPPPPPLRNKGPELGADNLTLEGVATELAPSDFVSQNYETLVALIQEETKKRSSQSLQARLNFGRQRQLILMVKKLEARVKIGKARRQARVVLSDDEDIADDSSKQGRKLSDVEVQEKASTDTKLFIQEVTPTEVIQDQESSEKASDKVSTAGAKKEKRSRQDKGKAIMIESEPKKKSKKELEQERLSYAEAIRLEEQMNEEQRAQIARDEEIARQWDEEERKRAMAEAKSTKKIDWNDPSGTKISDFKGMSYNDIRPIFEKVWDFNQNIEPMDAEHGSGKQKSPEKSPEKMKSAEKMEEDDVAKETGAKRKKEEASIEVESISTKFPIMDWKTCVLTETFMYYQVFRGDGISKKYKILSEMLEDFDRLDVEELYRLVKERYSTSRPEGFDLMLWGDLDTLFEPDEDDEIWKDQHESNLISWRLCDFCGIHILLMENGLAIHMLTEKKYPLSQEMISKMLNKKLEVDHESSQTTNSLLRKESIKAWDQQRKCRSPVLWAEIGESSLIGPELVQEITDKIVLIKEKLKAERDHQKSYADNRRKPLEFEVEDRVLLKVSPWKSVVCFGKKGKLAPRYVGPFEILKKIGPVAYRLRLPEELSSMYDTFHVSNLKKCLVDAVEYEDLD
ncbi:hypothetical protein Tco_0758429 [Tanacetum coccineum]